MPKWDGAVSRGECEGRFFFFVLSQSTRGLGHESCKRRQSAQSRRLREFKMATHAAVLLVSLPRLLLLPASQPALPPTDKVIYLPGPGILSLLLLRTNLISNGISWADYRKGVKQS